MLVLDRVRSGPSLRRRPVDRVASDSPAAVMASDDRALRVSYISTRTGRGRHVSLSYAGAASPSMTTCCAVPTGGMAGLGVGPDSFA